MFEAFSTVVAAMFRLPVERMPASPASTMPLGAMRSTSPALTPCDGREHADAAAGREAAEIGLHVGARDIDGHARGRRGDDRLRRGARGDVAIRGPDDHVAAAQGEDARLADVHALDP